MSDTTPPDTGIFTLWFSCNYGAILTTFALYRMLEQEGYKPLVLDQAPLTGNAKWQDATNVSRTFMARHGLRCGKPLQTDADLQQLNDELNTFIIGSDQVWRWRYTQSYGLLHFLDFVRGDKRKIAVSSSFGIDTEERPADMVRKASYYLQSFDAVSVREESGLQLLHEHYGVEGEWIQDPVFLCGTECYDELMQGTKIPQTPYLLSYVLEPDARIRNLIESIAAARGLEVINMVDAQKDFEQLRERFGGIGNIAQGVTPEQWVAYIRHCAYFVTDSFHGICFAHLYHRDFVCVAPHERGLTRFISLLKLTGLEHCLLSPDYAEAEWQAASAPIDWDAVQARIDAAIATGKNWLHRSLTAPRSERTKAQAELVYKLLYAGDGAKERHHDLEEELQQRINRYRTNTLPRQLLFQKALLRVLSYCPLPALRARYQRHLQALRRLARYLNTSK